MEPVQLSQINYTPLDIGHPKRPSKFKSFVLLSCAFLIGNLIGLVIFIARTNQNTVHLTSSVKAAVNNEDSRPDTIQIVKTSSSSAKLDPHSPDIYGTTMKFTSYKLGVTFNYLTHWWKKADSFEDKSTDVFVSRSMNKVCIAYTVSTKVENCENGQYILLFKKHTETSLKQAVEEGLLKDSNKDCIINTYKSGDKEFAEVVSLTSRCPETYTKKSVQRYFQYDSQFPDRFVFVSLSQRPILADTNYSTWEKTLTLFGSN